MERNFLCSYRILNYANFPKNKTNELRDSEKKSILLNGFFSTILARYNIVYESNMFITRIYCDVLFGLLFGE